jgi:hypothetical protein
MNINIIEKIRLRIIYNHLKRLVVERKGRRYILRFGDDVYELKIIKKHKV